MKVALVHDWLTGYRGGEKCLTAFLKLYPNADIYTLIHKKGSTTEQIDSRVKETSFLNKFPGVHKYYRHLLPLFPLAVKFFNFKGYDLVISLSHAAAKNIKVPKETKHICYCFTPMRYIWDQSKYYFGNLRFILFPILYLLRIWDRKNSKNVDCFIAISKFVAARIRCFYNRKSVVIHPPVQSKWIENKSFEKKDYYLWAGALVPYKRAELVIKTCSKYDIPLKVCGGGPLLNELKSISGSSVKFLGKVSDEELVKHYYSAKALLFPAIEDFGMIPVECQLAGTPVIAYDYGGSRETVNGIRYWSKDKNSNPSGLFLKRTKNISEEDLFLAIKKFESLQISKEDCIAHGEKFLEKTFEAKVKNLISKVC